MTVNGMYIMFSEKHKNLTPESPQNFSFKAAINLFSFQMKIFFEVNQSY
jgi:hypothetical protein